jgi:hypothetical protein
MYPPEATAASSAPLLDDAMPNQLRDPAVVRAVHEYPVTAIELPVMIVFCSP